MLENLWNVDSKGKQKNHEIIHGKPGRTMIDFRLREPVGLFGEFLLVGIIKCRKEITKKFASLCMTDREKRIPYANTYIWNLKKKFLLNLGAG